MKLLVAALALVAVTAAPALAQSSDHRAKAQARPSQSQRAPGIANQYGRTETSRHSTNSAHDVYDTHGQYMGSDPDPRVREALINDRTD